MAPIALSFGTALALVVASAWLGALAACASGDGERPAGPRAPASGATAGASPASEDGPDARAARGRLVEQVARTTPGLDPKVLAVLREVPRHLFMPGTGLADAYADNAFPIGHRQTISQPTVVAIMTDALRLRGDERVLEIGTGSGYQAAVLSRLAREVDTIEIVAPLGEEARERLARLGYRNVQVRIGDGYRGWPELAPFDRILLTAAPPELPATLVEQLADGGILVAPVGEADDQILARWTKHGPALDRELLGGVRFVPMVSATPER
ncbi:MAG TPA: protein-L-isoaspartate(D-aspartate) O-methyltransferase [Candidatus Binatia bacterium]|nr:protein-L-isoaspartate(D-aspartate) O-methyltransferase [Candidatus Binatia bacterium]